MRVAGKLWWTHKVERFFISSDNRLLDPTVQWDHRVGLLPEDCWHSRPIVCWAIYKFYSGRKWRFDVKLTGWLSLSLLFQPQLSVTKPYNRRLIFARHISSSEQSVSSGKLNTKYDLEICFSDITQLQSTTFLLVAAIPHHDIPNLKRSTWTRHDKSNQ